MKIWRAGCLLIGLFAVSGVENAVAECAACADGQQEQTVRFHLRGIASMAGSATIRITFGDIVTNTTMSGGLIEPGGSGKYRAGQFDCAQWEQEITVSPKLNQPVLIEYLYETNHASPDYTEFESLGGPNPAMVYSRPSSSCLTVWFDQDDGNWVPEAPILHHASTRIRMKGVLSFNDSNLGDSLGGPTAGGGRPVPDAPELMDSAVVGDLVSQGYCPGGSAMLPPSSETVKESLAAAGTATDKVSAVICIQPPMPSSSSVTSVVYSASKQSTSPAAASGLLNSSGSPDPLDSIPNGYSVADPIGRLRWEMSLGSAGRTLARGRIIYQTDAWDATAYSPARLSLAGGSDPVQVLLDTNGDVRQVLLDDNLVDVPTITNGFQVAVYPLTQVGAADPQTGFLAVSGPAALTWTIENPDATPQGRIRFTRVEGTNCETHEARWQGTAHVAGTLTIQRYGGQWTEEREYVPGAGNTQRVETISLFKAGVLQSKVREVYQEFYHWGSPGDVFEALVERVQDPDGKALTTRYVYYDQPELPGNLVYQTTYPDGYSERISQRLAGDGYSPVAASGGVVQRDEPFKDNAPGTDFGRLHYVSYAMSDPQHLSQTTYTFADGQPVGLHYTIHTFQDGFWIKQICDYTDYNFTYGYGHYAYREEWLEIATRRPAFIQDRNGKTTAFSYQAGYWDSATGTFSLGPDGNLPPGTRTTIIHGSSDHQLGIANKTTVEVTVDDQFGHAVLEESYVSDGTGATDPSRLIERKTYSYTDGRLTATHRNGRLVYEAGYYPDGALAWEQDETGRRTEYTCDEWRRVKQKTIRGRGGDPDRVTTYEYDALGNMTRQTTTAGNLSVQSRWVYDLAGELIQTVGIDGLTNFVDTSYTNGHKVVTETLPTKAVKVSSHFMDRQLRSVTGSAVEDEYYDPFVIGWTPDVCFEGRSVYRDGALTHLKLTQVVDWLGNEVLLQTLQFRGTGYRNRYTDYEVDFYGQVRPLPAQISETGRATQLFNYDELGLLTAQGLDLDGSGTLDEASVDQMTGYNSGFTNDTGVWKEFNTVLRYLQDNDASPTLFQESRTTVSAALTGNLTASNLLIRPGGGIVVTTVALDQVTGEQTTTNNNLELGQVQTHLERDGLLRAETQAGIGLPRNFSYTPLGELLVVNDPATGCVTNTYDPATRRLLSVTDNLNRQTLYDYYPASATNGGRLRGTRDAAGNWTWYDYTSAGQLFRRWGVNSYPVEKRYDEAGRMTNFQTFRTAPGTVNWASPIWPNPPPGDNTQWIYDPPSGLLERKVYANTGTVIKAVCYIYDEGSFLDTKTNARGQTITCDIDTAGRLRNVTYSDGAPSVALDYDRAGRLRSVTDASGTRHLTWTDRDQMETEIYTAGILAGVAVARGFDSQSRLETLGLSLEGVPVVRQRTAYDPISRVDYIANETPDGSTVLQRFDYTFKTNTPFVQSVDFFDAATAVMTNRYTWDGRGRLAGAGTTLAAGDVVNGVGYQFNNLDRRYRADLADGTTWNYGYNDRGEVISGKHVLDSGLYAGGEQFEYQSDDIGNRIRTRTGGDTNGANLREAGYTANALNQYTSRDIPGSVWILGNAPTNLILHGLAAGRAFAAQRQKGGRFFGEAIADNRTNAVFARITVAGKTNGALADMQTGYKFVPQNPESFAFDDDGNLTSDGRWTYTWDAENRLITVTACADIPDAAKKKLEFMYDDEGRRIQKVVSTWNGSQYVAQSTNRFVYDGWNLIAVLNSDLSLQTSYTWGLDLRGTMQGAGGVGGLLSATEHQVTNTAAHFFSFDGNGNVLALVNAADGNLAAQYEYGPFGELLRATGPMARVNPFRWSTQYSDDETLLVMYPARPYNPSTGRFLSKDPIEEQGGLNVYSFVGNNPVNSVDIWGLWGSDVHRGKTIEWGKALDYPEPAATAIGKADEAVDGISGGKSWAPWIGDQSYHFNRSLGARDSRLRHNAVHLREAENACTMSAGRDDPEEAARHLGTALHPLQDWVAHGDFFSKWAGPITAVHNTYSLQKDISSPKGKTGVVDDVDFDAVMPDGSLGPDGRATGPVMQYYRVGGGPGIRRGDPTDRGMLVDWAYFKPGHLRITKTKELTEGDLKSFQDYVRANGGCKCKRYFGVQ